MKLLERFFSSKVKIKVLRRFIRSKEWLFNLTELSKDLGMNKGVVSRILKDLEKERVITSFRKGKISLFKLNKKNKFVKNFVIPVYELEDKLPKDIENKIINTFKSTAVSIIIYGSYVRDEFTGSSDIDVMIVAENKKKVENIARKVSEEFLSEDLVLVIDVISVNEFKALYKRKEPLILNIIKMGKVLFGKNPREII